MAKLSHAFIAAIILCLLLVLGVAAFKLGRVIEDEGSPHHEQPEPYNASISLPTPPNLAQIPELRARSPRRVDRNPQMAPSDIQARTEEDGRKTAGSTQGRVEAGDPGEHTAETQPKLVPALEPDPTLLPEGAQGG